MRDIFFFMNSYSSMFTRLKCSETDYSFNQLSISFMINCISKFSNTFYFINSTFHTTHRNYESFKILRSSQKSRTHYKSLIWVEKYSISCIDRPKITVNSILVHHYIHSTENASYLKKCIFCKCTITKASHIFVKVFN